MSEHLSPTQAARRLGISVKALKVYERHGLVRPHRLANGWRIYGPDQILRVHEVLALKATGLSLARIGALVSGKDADLDRTLDLQERILLERRDAAVRALALLSSMRRRRAAGETLGLSDLLELAKAGAAAPEIWGPALNRYYIRHMGEEAVSRLEGGDANEWLGLIADLKSLAARDADPAGAEASSFFTRWLTASDRVVRGDASAYESSYAAWMDALEDPHVSPLLPLDRDAIVYLQRVAEAVEAAAQKTNL